MTTLQETNWAHWVAMQCGVVPYSEDDPGWGKTAGHRSLAEQTGRRFIQVILSQCLREDIGGIPVPSDVVILDKEYRGVTPLMNETMLRMHYEPCVVLFDEMNQPPTDVLGAAQEIINNPPPGAWLAGCGNSPERSTCGQEFTAPLTNRMCMLKWERHNDERRVGWENGFQNYPAPYIPIVPPDYLEYFGRKWGKLLCLFEDVYPEHFGLNTFPVVDAKDKNQDNSTGGEPGSRPWRSGRSWTNAGKLLAACEAVGASNSTAFKAAAGCIGMGPASEFLGWVDQQDLPNPRYVLEHPDSLKLPTRFDLARAVVSGVIGVVKQENNGHVWEQGFDVMERVFVQNREVALASIGSLQNLKPKDHDQKRRGGVALEINELLTMKHGLQYA